MTHPFPGAPPASPEQDGPRHAWADRRTTGPPTRTPRGQLKEFQGYFMDTSGLHRGYFRYPRTVIIPDSEW